MAPLSKLKTLTRYVALGNRLGADPRSRLVLATRLPVLRVRRWLGLRDDPPRAIRLRLGDASVPILFRTEDVFPLADVFDGAGYLPEDLKGTPPRVILDLGAHIGLASLRFAAAFPNALIHAYEPDPDNLAILRGNLAGVPHAVVHAAAIGDRPGEAVLYTRRGRHTSGSLLRPAREGDAKPVTCRVQSLDVAIQEAGPVDLIKFDIEGAEHRALAASSLVHDVPHLVGEIKGAPDRVDALCRLLPGHRADITPAGTGMYVIHFSRSSSAVPGPRRPSSAPAR